MNHERYRYTGKSGGHGVPPSRRGREPRRRAASGKYCAWRISKSPRAASSRAPSSATSRAAWRRTHRVDRQPRRLRRVRVPAARARQHPGPPSEDDAVRAHLRSAVRFSADGRHFARRLQGRRRPRQGRGGVQHGHDPERRVADADGARQGSRTDRVVPGVSARGARDHHAARGAGAAGGFRSARAHGGRAGVREPREQRAQRLQLAAEADAAAGMGLHAAAALARSARSAARS